MAFGARAQAAALGDTAANAGGDHLQWLTWNVPAACPNREDLANRIEVIVGRPVGAELEFAVLASVTEADTGFHLKMRIAYDGAVGVRELAFTNCAEAFEFVSIAVALAIDPDRNSIPSESQSLPDETPAPTQLPGAVIPPSKEPPSATSAQPRPLPGRPRPPTPWFVRAGVNFSTGLLPQPGFGPTVGGGRMFGLWAVWADITFLPGSSYELDQGFNPVSMRWLGGTLGACRFVQVSSLSGGPCMRLQFGGLTGREEAAEAGRSPHEGTGFFLGILAGLEGRLGLGKRVHAFASAGASFPVVADDFVLSDGTLVYRPGLGFQASLGLMYFF